MEAKPLSLKKLLQAVTELNDLPELLNLDSLLLATQPNSTPKSLITNNSNHFYVVPLLYPQNHVIAVQLLEFEETGHNFTSHTLYIYELETSRLHISPRVEQLKKRFEHMPYFEEFMDALTVNVKELFENLKGHLRLNNNRTRFSIHIYEKHGDNYITIDFRAGNEMDADQILNLFRDGHFYRGTSLSSAKQLLYRRRLTSQKRPYNHQRYLDVSDAQKRYLKRLSSQLDVPIPYVSNMAEASHAIQQLLSELKEKRNA